MTWCCACKQECSVIEVDFGIGSYEYWGAKGVDIDLQEVSDCCEADWTEEDPNEDETEENNG
jgi:hypothetical protein